MRSRAACTYLIYIASTQLVFRLRCLSLLYTMLSIESMVSIFGYRTHTQRQLHAISFCFYPAIAQPTKRTSERREQITNKSMAEHHGELVFIVDAAMHVSANDNALALHRNRNSFTHSLTCRKFIIM